MTVISHRSFKIDPQVEQFSTALREAFSSQGMSLDTPVEESRRIAEQVREPWARGGPVMAATTTRNVEVDGSELRMRIYTPREAVAGPMLLYLHGGGWTLHSIDTHDRLMREYAERARIRVIGMDYSLAPECKFPQPVEEVGSVIRWLHEDAAALEVDPGQIVVGGDSAGANLAVAGCLLLRDHEPALQPCGLLLNYGAYDPGVIDSLDGVQVPAEFTLTRAEMRMFWHNYLRGPADKSDPLVNPLNARLAGLPPTMMVIADGDVLYDENIELANRLRAAGVRVRSEVYPGTIHSFLEAVSVARVAEQALDESAAWLSELLITPRRQA